MPEGRRIDDLLESVILKTSNCLKVIREKQESVQEFSTLKVLNEFWEV